MKFWMFLAFLFAVASFGWWMKAVEHMTERNPIYGPKIVNREKCVREYPEVYTADTYLLDGTIDKELPANVPVDSATPTSAVPNIRNKPEGPGSTTTSTTTGTRQKSAPADRKTNGSTPMMMDRTQLSGPSSSWEQDDGTVSSDTATSNPLFQQVYAYNPQFQTSFPVSGPPQAYLTDFSKIHS
jgi:hypothetical protein